MNKNTQEIIRLKAQVAALTELLQVQEQTVLEQSTQLEQTLAALQESEGRLRSIFENIMQDAYFRTDLEDRLIWGSPSTARLLGFESLVELIGCKLVEEFHIAPEKWQALSDELHTKDKVYEYELELHRRDGNVIIVSTNASLYQDDNGHTAGIEGIFRDITERKQAEADRERMQQEIIEAQQQALKELSTPIIPVMDTPQGGIIVMPLIGSIDTMRAREITRQLLAGISRYRAKVVILDVTGVPLVDSGVAAHLNKTIQAARLKGARTIVTGISDAVAETIVDLGIDWSRIQTLRDLQTGLITALNMLGFEVTGKQGDK